eukprot:3905015-Rhodomonas_salina.2
MSADDAISIGGGRVHESGEYDAGDEALVARELLGGTEVDEAEPVVGEEHEVAAVGVGVEEAVRQQLLPVHAHHEVHDARRVRRRRAPHQVQPACAPAEREVVEDDAE